MVAKRQNTEPHSAYLFFTGRPDACDDIRAGTAIDETAGVFEVTAA